MGLDQNLKAECELLLPVLDLIITEKRIEYRDKINVTINFDQTNESYGLFCSINPTEIKRILSNIINNAVEALINQKGSIEIRLFQCNNSKIHIEIIDNGKGIPQEYINQLGIRGNSFGKVTGSGLGLAHAKETLEILGGTLEIRSKIDQGTVITLILPKADAPDWFVPKLILKPTSTVIVFDDDQSIHQIWEGRLEPFLQDHSKNIKILHYSNPLELKKYYGQNFADLENAIFLMDYEILNHFESGLNLIEELGIQQQAILVTSRYEETDIRSRCKQLNVRLIPKSMSGFVPIEMQ